MKIFVLGIPHTVTSSVFSTCAFTQKVANLCKMMHRAGHEVYHLGVEGSIVEGKHVTIMSHEEWSALYKHPGADFYDTGEDGEKARYMRRWANFARAAMLERTEDDWSSIVCCTWGGAQRRAMEGVRQFEVESGIGYMHSWAKYRVYESYAWLHMHLGRDNNFFAPPWYYNVIPNAFDMSYFSPKKPGDVKKDFLYLGRLQDDKGIRIAIDVTKRIGARLTIVGQGDPKPYTTGIEDRVTYMPPVGFGDRLQLLQEHRGVFTPSIYVEPFCGVAIEAALCGTPVISTDWGAFSENVLHGVTGYRCRNMDQFVWAAKNIDKIKAQDCVEWASANFSLERIAPMYEEYFKSVLGTAGAGDWNFVDHDRQDHDAFTRRFPFGN